MSNAFADFNTYVLDAYSHQVADDILNGAAIMRALDPNPVPYKEPKKTANQKRYEKRLELARIELRKILKKFPELQYEFGDNDE